MIAILHVHMSEDRHTIIVIPGILPHVCASGAYINHLKASVDLWTTTLRMLLKIV